jgi:hypothetical protein
VADHPLRPATRLCLGKPLPYQLADGPQTPPPAIGRCRSQPLPSHGEPQNAVCGISAPFGTLSPAEGQIIYVLRTRAPLSGVTPLSCDLHVLGVPLTFALSQDQTLQLENCELIDLAIAVASTRLGCSLDRFPSRAARCPKATRLRVTPIQFSTAERATFPTKRGWKD